MIYLLNQKPSRAQATLANANRGLSNEMCSQRVLIESRALSDIGRHDLAIDHPNLGPEAIRLRADIHGRQALARGGSRSNCCTASAGKASIR